ncbi:MAG: hypothetical protein LBG29_01130, partial [Synergistaceae bacterium]|nr:hypothetical protein [Synergistaceae bacterium]
MAAIGILTFEQEAMAAISSWTGLSTALSSAAAGNTLTLTSNITFSNSSSALIINKLNLTIQGANGGAAVGANIDDEVWQQITDPLMSLSADDLSDLSGKLGQFASAADTLTSNYAPSAAALSGMTAITGNDNLRNLTTADTFQNQRKWLHTSATASSSPGNGLSLKNLNFKDVKIEYGGFNNTTEAKYGVVNGLIGNTNSASVTTTLGSITGNAFTDISVTMKGAQGVDTQYLAGGGVIGVRATGEPIGATKNASATIDTVSGNYFSGVTIETTNDQGSWQNQPKSAYIEGGGIVGVDAASTPDNKTTGIARLGTLTNNYFTNIKIHTGDILIGGGLVGLNNNSKYTGANTPIQANTYVILNNANGNIFADGIDVQAYYSIRGGGVIGLNGLSTAGAQLDALNHNIFSDVHVASLKSYIKGGGIVGLQTNYTEDADKDKFPEDPTNPDPIDVTTPWTQLNGASGNVFLDSTVTANSYLYGGGIVGLHSASAAAVLGTLDSNLFKGLTVTTEDNDADQTNPYGLKGGGIVGLSSAGAGVIGKVDKNYFDDITVNVNNNKLAGGGVIGIQSDSVDTYTLNFGGNITRNSFTNINVNAGAIEGGGLVGAHSKGAYAAFVGEDEGETSGLSGNRVNKVTVNTSDYISGGGVFGVYSNTGYTYIQNVSHNAFDSVTVNAGSYIQGGGIIGLRTD